MLHDSQYSYKGCMLSYEYEGNKYVCCVNEEEELYFANRYSVRNIKLFKNRREGALYLGECVKKGSLKYDEFMVSDARLKYYVDLEDAGGSIKTPQQWSDEFEKHVLTNEFYSY